MHIDEEEINKIRQSANIVEIINSYIPLTQKGKNYFGVCPFHEDHSPSMSVTSEKGIYKCFSCGASGNVFKFVSDYENVSFPEAVKIVAEKIGITLKGNFARKKDEKHKDEYQVMNLASLFFQNNLATIKGEEARAYLEKRGLNENVIRDFQIGLSLDKNTLHSFLTKKKYPDKLLVDLGLINQKDIQFHDSFVNRIIFPIHNLEGEVVGFTGRIYKEDSSPPKYYNSKETSIFKKGNILFNYHRAKDAIRLEKKVIIVEGNMDAIRMYSNGIKNTIALMGTSLTNAQVKEIKKLRVPVVLMLDNDAAGEIATYQVGNILEKEGLHVSVVRLSGEKDPDEYIIKNGQTAILDNIKNAISFLEFKLRYHKRNKNLQDSEELAKYIKEVLEGMKDNQDEILKEITLKKLSDEYGISLDILKSELSKITTKEIAKQKENSEKNPKKKNKYEDGVFHILYFMMNEPIYIKMYKAKLGFLDQPLYRGIANEIMAYYELHKTINLADFISYAENSKLKKEIFEVIESIKDENMEESIMEEYITSIKKTIKKQEIIKLKDQLKNEVDSNKKMKLLTRIQEIKKEV